MTLIRLIHINIVYKTPEYHLSNRHLERKNKRLNPKDSKLRNLPDGFNYAFHNTPAMRMP